MFTSWLKPHLFFLLLALPTGLLLIFLTPPFQSPDEVNHFFKAWQISEGHWVGQKQDDRVGGKIPRSVIQVTKPFLAARYDPHSHISSETICDAAKISDSSDSAEFMDFPNTAVYSPICYLPQATTICILRLFGLPPLVIFYCARLAGFLFWLMMVYFSIRKLTAFQWILTALALLPMSLSTNSSLTADVMTNATAFYLLAFLLGAIMNGEKFVRKTWLMAGLLAFLIASVKPVYWPLLLLMFLIPSSSFVRPQRRWLIIGSVFIVAVVTVSVWSSYTHKIYTPYETYNPEFREGIDLMKNADAYDQLNYMLSDWSYSCKVALLSVTRNVQQYSTSYIGRLGYFDALLPIWLVAIFYLLLISIALAERGGGQLRLKSILVLLSVFVISFLAIIISQHLVWDAVGSERVMILQGRYLIPIAPLLFISMTKLSRYREKYAIGLSILCSLLSITSIFTVTYFRYYG
jgi:uncharacterized membrane protein